MKGSCQQTRTDTTAADRPPDAEKRRDTQRHPKSFRNPQPQLRLPTPGRAGQGGRPNPRPDSTESTTDTHGRSVGNPPAADRRPQRAARAARRIPARTICVGCVGGRGGSRPSRPPHGHSGRSSGGGGKSRLRSSLAAAGGARLVKVGAGNSIWRCVRARTEPSASSMQSNTERTAFSLIVPSPGVLFG